MHSGLKRIESRFDCKVDNNLISTIYAHLESESISRVTINENYFDKEKEAEVLEAYIIQNDLYFNDLKFSVYLEEGAEQKVFFDSDKSKVIKLNDAIFYVNWTQYFESLIIHNILFKETKYELIGFIKINKTIYSVVQQDYIEPSEKTNIKMVKDVMLSKGFTIKKRNDYIHTELGLIIEDLHEENVLVKDGILFFIDTVIYLK